eukprot:c13684_g1_i2.p1 GENE.c13684_g1_i2~~c13684_g1_i2.p1  ORF type:complete len:1168 (+),score=258.71 c13684_g1_i2:402-3506(+)
MNPTDLIRNKEEGTEVGGYFIINGMERCIRMLIVPKRNYITAIVRQSLLNRGPQFTPYLTSMRCVREDQSAQSVTLHYLSNSSLLFRILLRRQEFFIPFVVIVRALVGASDRFIFESVVNSASLFVPAAGSSDTDTFVASQTEAMLSRFAAVEGPLLKTQKLCLNHLGKHFKSVMESTPADTPDHLVGEELLRRHFFVHLSSPSSPISQNENSDTTSQSPATIAMNKFHLCVLMASKLLALANGNIQPDNADALDSQEILLPGHLYTAYLKEKLGESLNLLVAQLDRDARKQTLVPQEWADPKYFRQMVDRANVDIGRRLTYMVSTGNLQTQTGMDLMQTAGYSISAERINFFRFLSHFRSVHRGSFFAELRTTEVRKLLPESWGFVCPVHTPDGSPCGLLNHLTQHCEVTTIEQDCHRLPNTLLDLGMIPVRANQPAPPQHMFIVLNGVVLGYIHALRAKAFASSLRLLKIDPAFDAVPSTLEIAVVCRDNSKAFPGIFLSTGAGRPVRQVINLQVPGGARESISPMEQLYLTIACMSRDHKPSITTHQEICPTEMLSVLASFTPFSDFNQSPRNMYQCQMAKQTMGTATHCYTHRTDGKLYRINTPQRPLVRNKGYNERGMDEYPMGTNAVVAVIAYSGYDMEDAMIINKASMERGFKHGMIYTTKVIDLADYSRPGDDQAFVFAAPENAAVAAQCQAQHIDSDGFIAPATTVNEGDALCTFQDTTTGTFKAFPHKSNEPAIVDQVRVIRTTNLKTSVDQPCQKVSIKLRYTRNPQIGDKFASRHGQKGVVSQLWPERDMPFTDSGIIPDILFNPHGFPSRMTIGMLIESICAKGAALHGVFHDSTPFQFTENDHTTAVDFFGAQLAKTGYNYYGTELMYSGTSGEPLECHIFTGIVYYQRLRHMVSDKFQVRATGPVNSLTHQPVKGRKAHGGIRLGEMERDALIAHGAAFITHDRLFTCSDADTAAVCTKCGSVLSVVSDRMGRREHEKAGWMCVRCKAACGVVKMPYVMKLLIHELAGMNIQVRMTLDD